MAVLCSSASSFIRKYLAQFLYLLGYLEPWECFWGSACSCLRKPPTFFAFNKLLLMSSLKNCLVLVHSSSHMLAHFGCNAVFNLLCLKEQRSCDTWPRREMASTTYCFLHITITLQWAISDSYQGNCDFLDVLLHVYEIEIWLFLLIVELAPDFLVSKWYTLINTILRYEKV